MLKRILTIVGLLVALVVVAGMVLFALGARVVLDGAGMPRIAFPRPADEHAEAIARHREAQRAAAPPSAAKAPTASPEAAGDEPPDPSSSGKPAPAASAGGTTSARPDDGANGASWTDFRGPRRDGEYRRSPIRTDWPEGGLRRMWKQPVGGGYASFVVAQGRAFTIEQRGGDEVVAAYDVATGRELWTHTWRATFRESMGGDGPRATPTWHDGTVYALGGTGELRALDDATGRQRWRVNILDDAGASNLQWGMAASPLVVGDTVVVLPGGGNGRSVAAYDRATGQRVWTALDDRASYASPMLVTLGGVEQILVFTASRLAALTTDGQRLLWEFPWRTQYDVNASQPLLIGGDRVFISTGYGTGAALVQVALEGDRFTARELWRTNRMKNQFTSSVHHDGFIYGLDESILACLDASTGELKWKGGRYGYGQVMLASGHLVVLSERGELALVRATPEGHRELAIFQALEDAKTWNHPAMADGILLIRNITEMAAFDLRRSTTK